MGRELLAFALLLLHRLAVFSYIFCALSLVRHLHWLNNFLSEALFSFQTSQPTKCKNGKGRCPALSPVPHHWIRHWKTALSVVANEKPQWFLPTSKLLLGTILGKAGGESVWGVPLTSLSSHGSVPW